MVKACKFEYLLWRIGGDALPGKWQRPIRGKNLRLRYLALATATTSKT